MATATQAPQEDTKSSTINITVLISGNGSNLQALIDNQTHPSSASTSASGDATKPKGKFPTNAQITHVISNRKAAYGLQRAQKASIPTTYHNLVAYKKKHPDTEAGIQQAREEYDRDLADIIIGHNNNKSNNDGDSEEKSRTQTDLVICAGWMHILSNPFINALHTANITIINLHPALPGKFNGAEAIHRAWEAFQRGEIVETGVMVHHVIGEVDMGEPIMVREVECIVEEPESQLETRIHSVEWELIVDATVKVLGEIEEQKKRKRKKKDSPS